ncbi:MAG TPA: DUF2065 domain-containing protein [Spongiibacteraceae bacterium]|nr:DUF2065 domain-containing protein [Spongiibacteraceae bacterium]HCS26326.1 DUF2065 domain-containing protein [Spongiibacteraceae bacterium]|tara:strand:+ start:606 stop:791 length:186 start_codon:yes stop_codon:yes gene_type:complete
MWHELLIAFSLVMIIEGIIPFISPVQWRTVVLTVARSSDKQIRIVGLVSMLAGVVLLNWVQ